MQNEYSQSQLNIDYRYTEEQDNDEIGSNLEGSIKEQNDLGGTLQNQ